MLTFLDGLSKPLSTQHCRISFYSGPGSRYWFPHRKAGGLFHNGSLRRLVMQDDVQQGAVHVQFPVVVDEA